MTALSSTQVLGFVLLDITIILIAARAMGALARKIGQPTVVGEIFAGILLGPTLLGRTVFAWDTPWGFLHCDAALAQIGADPSITNCLFPPQSRSMLGVIGQLALVFFMFLVGLELDYKLLSGKAKSVGLLAFGVVAVPVGLAFAIGPPLYREAFVPDFGTPAAAQQLTFTLFLAAMLSVTAFPVMARILQEKGLTTSAMGSVGVAAAAVVTVLMFLLVAVASGVASDQGPAGMGVKFLAAAVYIAAMFLVVRPLLVPLGRRYEAAGHLTPGMFAGILILLFASAYVAHQIGINVIVGGFLAGAVLPHRKVLFREMSARLSDLTAVVLLPIFLAFSGLNTDFTTLAISHIPAIVLFVVAGIVGKWLGGAVFARLGGLSWQEGNVLGILMNCRGLLVLVVALIAFDEGVISAPMQVAGVVMALVTTMMTGPLFDRFGPRATLPAEADVLDAAPIGQIRVLAVIDELEDAATVAAAAFRFAGDRPAEVVLCRLFSLPVYDELPADISGSTEESERSVELLRALSAFAPETVSVVPLAFSSADTGADVVRIATERNCDVVVTGWRRGDARSTVSDLRTLHSQARRVIVACELGRVEQASAGPVVLTGTPSESASEFAERLAGEHEVMDEPVAGLDLAIVVGLDPVGAETDAADLATFAAAPGPMYLVVDGSQIDAAQGASGAETVTR